MFKLALAPYLLDKKIGGYYLYKRCGFFNYKEEIKDGKQVDLIDFILKNEITVSKSPYNYVKEYTKKKVENKEGMYKYHIEHAIEEGTPYDYATFEDFIAEFTKIQLLDGWERTEEFPESFFSKKYNSKIHANHIQFEGVYMIMKTVIDFLRFTEWVEENKMIKDVVKNRVYKW